MAHTFLVPMPLLAHLSSAANHRKPRFCFRSVSVPDQCLVSGRSLQPLVSPSSSLKTISSCLPSALWFPSRWWRCSQVISCSAVSPTVPSGRPAIQRRISHRHAPATVITHAVVGGDTGLHFTLPGQASEFGDRWHFGTEEMGGG